MRGIRVLALATSFVLAAAVVAPGAKIVGEEAGSSPVPRPSADLDWIELDPVGAPGVEVAPLWGDHREGAFGAFFKLPAGFAVPLHRHSHDMKLITVSGTYLQAPEGEAEFRLGPGSYLLQPGGEYRHTTSCDPAEDCVFFVESEGAFDLHLVATQEPPPAE